MKKANFGPDEKMSNNTPEENARRAREFQMGKNPVEMGEFEKKLVRNDKRDRYITKVKQVLGSQGPDGGKCPRIYEE